VVITGAQSRAFIGCYKHDIDRIFYKEQHLENEAPSLSLATEMMMMMMMLIILVDMDLVSLLKLEVNEANPKVHYRVHKSPPAPLLCATRIQSKTS